MQIKKWRPTYKCLYVIPEIHGNIRSLEIILDRILPLRVHSGQEDIIVFLGDYIDKGTDSYDVIQCLINIKKEYNDRVIILKGNHEDMMENSLRSEDAYNAWKINFGSNTIKSYMQKANLDGDVMTFPLSRFQSIVPKDHVDFISNMNVIFSFDDYVFFHGSFDPSKKIEENSDRNFIYDRTCARMVKSAIVKNEKISLFDNYDKVFVASHGFKSKDPILYSRYLMLGGDAPQRLFAFELNSMTARMVKRNKSRMYKYKFKYYE